MKAPHTEQDLKALVALDTPTVCNALEMLSAEFRTNGFTFQPMVCAFPDLPPIVGYARTATIRAMRPSKLDKKAVQEQRIAYYQHIENGPRPSIAVIQDLDTLPGFGAFWGEVNTAIHKGLGCIGTVTDGCIRDIPQMAPGFQCLAGSINPSHGWCHVEEVGGTVSIHGMTVHDGDLVHADRHGAVVIPHDLVRKLPEAAALVARKEAVILAAARKPGFSAEALRKAMGDAEDVH